MKKDRLAPEKRTVVNDVTSSSHKGERGTGEEKGGGCFFGSKEKWERWEGAGRLPRSPRSRGAGNPDPSWQASETDPRATEAQQPPKEPPSPDAHKPPTSTMQFRKDQA